MTVLQLSVILQEPPGSIPKKGDFSCPGNEFIHIYLSFMLFMCFFHCLEWKRILHWYGNADTGLFEYK